jgi:hypothetical protein
MNKATATVKDYIYCEDCDEFVDFWKYNHSLEDCGYENCKWRYVTKKELKGCIKECEEWHCFDEHFVKPVMIIGEHKTAMSLVN